MMRQTGHAMVEVDPRSDRRWAELHTRGGGLFSSAPWISAVAEAYDFEPRSRLVTDSDGSPIAGIAYCRVDDLRGPRLVSFPFSDYHEPLGDDAAAIAALIESLASEGSARLQIPEDRLPDDLGSLHGLRTRCDLVTHFIEVDRGLDNDAAFATLHPKVRQNVRRSIRSGVAVELRSDLAAVREFYDMHVEVRTRKYRLLPQPFSFFEALHRRFEPRDELFVALARYEGRPIAGILYLESGGSLYYKYNASLADDLGVRPNEHLVWAGLELCARRGLRGIDLGVSDLDQEGLLRYKRKLTPIEGRVVTLVGDTGSGDPSSGVEALLPALTGLFTRDDVPTHIAESAGELLYRYFA